MKKILVFLLFCLIINKIYSQSRYDELKIKYDYYRKNNIKDSAFIFAKNMNKYALTIESDTSLKYAVSLRYIANVFYSLNRDPYEAASKYAK